jgi:hypothetical protein
MIEEDSEIEVQVLKKSPFKQVITN